MVILLLSIVWVLYDINSKLRYTDINDRYRYNTLYIYIYIYI